MSDYKVPAKSVGDVVVFPEDVSSRPLREKLMVVVDVRDRGEGELAHIDPKYREAYRHVVTVMQHDGTICRGVFHDFGKVEDSAPAETLALAEAWKMADRVKP